MYGTHSLLRPEVYIRTSSANDIIYLSAFRDLIHSEVFLHDYTMNIMCISTISCYSSTLARQSIWSTFQMHNPLFNIFITYLYIASTKHKLLIIDPIITYY